VSTEGEERGFHERDRDIQRLIDETRAAVGPNAWPRVEALIGELIDLYGVAIDRVLRIAHEIGGDTTMLDERLSRDRVVAGLLCVHDLHPVPLEERVRSVVATGSAEGLEPGALEVVSIHEGVVTVRGRGSHATPSAPVARLAARAIANVAPEVVDVRVLGLVAPPDTSLIPANRLVRGEHA
jgi:hypothetical protein